MRRRGVGLVRITVGATKLKRTGKTIALRRIGMKRTLLVVLVVILGGAAAWADDDVLRDLGGIAAPGEIPKWDGIQWRNAHDDNVPVNAMSGLVGETTNGEINISVAFGGQRTNNLVAAFSDLDATRPPIGAVVAWAKSIAGVSTNLPAGWVECNGQVLSNANSPMNGATIPNLNGVGGQPQRFLRGAQVSGGTGGVDSVILGHSPNSSIDHFDSTGEEGYNDHVFDPKPPYFEIVWIIRVQ